MLNKSQVQENNCIELMEDLRQISIDIDISFYPKDEDGNNAIDKEYKNIRKLEKELANYLKKIYYQNMITYI